MEYIDDDFNYCHTHQLVLDTQGYIDEPGHSLVYYVDRDYKEKFTTYNLDAIRETKFEELMIYSYSDVVALPELFETLVDICAKIIIIEYGGFDLKHLKGKIPEFLVTKSMIFDHLNKIPAGFEFTMAYYLKVQNENVDNLIGRCNCNRLTTNAPIIANAHCYADVKEIKFIVHPKTYKKIMQSGDYLQNKNIKFKFITCAPAAYDLKKFGANITSLCLRSNLEGIADLHYYFETVIHDMKFTFESQYLHMGSIRYNMKFAKLAESLLEKYHVVIKSNVPVLQNLQRVNEEHSRHTRFFNSSSRNLH